jgi:hypothetical protein
VNSGNTDKISSHAIILFWILRRCMGTGQHLKNRYGSGYLLELKLKSLGSETSGSASLADVDSSRAGRKENLTTFINSLFTSAHVQESFEDRIIFGIAQDNISSLSETFQALEEGRLIIIHNLSSIHFSSIVVYNMLEHKGKYVFVWLASVIWMA